MSHKEKLGNGDIIYLIYVLRERQQAKKGKVSRLLIWPT